MSVFAITHQAPALQQQLTRALVEPAHGVLPEAVAVELVPAWSLLTGDALMSLAAKVLPERPGLKMVTAALLKLRAGQCAEIAFDQCAGIGAEEALAAPSGKNEALLACACQLRALAGGADEEQVRLPTVLTVAPRKPLFPGHSPSSWQGGADPRAWNCLIAGARGRPEPRTHPKPLVRPNEISGQTSRRGQT